MAAFFCFSSYPSNNTWFVLLSLTLMFLLSLFFTLEYETSPLCDMGLSFPERGTCTTEYGDFKYPGFLGSVWWGAPASSRAVAIPGSSSSPAEEGTDLGQNNEPQLMRPPPSGQAQTATTTHFATNRKPVYQPQK